MFSQQTCRNSLGNLTIEILKVVEKRKIYKSERYQVNPGAKDLTKKIAWVAGI